MKRLGEIVIRDMMEVDCPVISAAFAAQGWQKPAVLYLRYLDEQRAGQRSVLLAEWDGRFAGYLTILWQSSYPPFRDAGIPEIADFNVLRVYQRRGIGTALMDAAEARIAGVSEMAGIAVGLTADYGPAQALYVRRGYVPDGRGLFRAGEWVERGDWIVVDDEVTLHLTKWVRMTE